MKFSTLVHEIKAYIKRDHAHSIWNMKYLYCTSNTDSQGVSHYRISYKEPGRKFSIKICKNNIKFHNIQNLPGSVSHRHARILGPCIRFARHHGKYNGMGEKAWKQMRTECKYANYDIKQWDHNSKRKDTKENNSSYGTLGYDGLTGKPVVKEAQVILNIMSYPKEYLGRSITYNEFNAIVMLRRNRLGILNRLIISSNQDDINRINKLFKEYEKYNNVEIIA